MPGYIETLEDLQQFISKMASEPLSLDHPLWEIQVQTFSFYSFVFSFRLLSFLLIIVICYTVLLYTIMSSSAFCILLLLMLF